MSSTSEPAMEQAPPISHLTNSLEKALDQNIELFVEMTRFTKGETFRFANKRLEHTEQAVDQLHGSRGIPGLLNAQQEWLLELMQDYTNQSLRYAELLRVLGKNAQSHAQSFANEMGEQAKAEMDDPHHEAQEAVAAEDQQPHDQAHDQRNSAEQPAPGAHYTA